MTIRKNVHRSFNEQRKSFRKNRCNTRTKYPLFELMAFMRNFYSAATAASRHISGHVWFFPGLQMFEQMQCGERLLARYTPWPLIQMIPDFQTTLKSFGLRSRGLQSRCGNNSHSGSESRLPPQIVDSGFAVKISPRFLVSSTDLQSRQQPTFTRFARFIHLFWGFLDDHLTWPLKHARFCKLILTEACFPIPVTLSMGKLTLNRPSLQSPICNHPDFGRHVTSPNQGLPSLASWGVKRRDPGNEVGDFFDFLVLICQSKGSSRTKPFAAVVRGLFVLASPSWPLVNNFCIYSLVIGFLCTAGPT